MFQRTKRHARPLLAGAEVTEGWRQLSLPRFFEVKDLPEGEDYDLQLTSILTGLPVDQLEALPINEFMKIKSRVAWIKNEPLPDIEERRVYVVDYGTNWRAFDACLDIRKWTASQYIDYQGLAGDTSTPEAVARLLTIYLVPAGREYGDGYDFDELREFFLKHFPALDAFALHNFFAVRSVGLIASIQISWALVRAAAKGGKAKQMRAEIRRLRKLTRAAADSARSGAGFPLSTPLPRRRGFPGRRRYVWELSRLSTR